MVDDAAEVRGRHGEALDRPRAARVAPQPAVERVDDAEDVARAEDRDWERTAREARAACGTPSVWRAS